MHYTLLFLLFALTSTYLAEAGKLQYPLGEAERLFEEYIVQYNKAYKSDEEKQMRFDNFQRNLKEMNEKNVNDEDTATYGINQFTDMNEDEFKEFSSGISGSDNNSYNSCVPKRFSRNLTLSAPPEHDWAQQGKVSPVKNQGQPTKCGSCWTFSAAGHLESQYAINKGQMTELSEQQLVDCDTSSNGCDGGYIQNAFSYVKDNGLMTDQAYPYQAAQGTCRGDAGQAAVKVTQCYEHHFSSEDDLLELVYTKGPISIQLCAKSWKDYSSGILQKSCSVDRHAVLVVGYGEEQGTKFWKIKNSWGPQWGEQGFIRLLRGANTCDVMTGGAWSADLQ